MKHYITVKGDKILNIISLPDDIAKPKDFIEVDEEYRDILYSGKPLLYKSEEVVVDTVLYDEQKRKDALCEEMAYLVGNLESTDYAVIKIAEGVATKEDYADVLKDRAEWRKRINEIEKEIGNGDNRI